MNDTSSSSKAAVTAAVAAVNHVLIVGGAKGIGREVARRLSSQGLRLTVADKDDQGLADLRDELGSGVETVPLDITDPGSVARALQRIGARGGKLNAVVMSAAVHSTYPAEFLPDDHIDRVITVNLTAHIKFIREVLHLVEDGGRLVGLSSNCADIGIPMESVYAASKAGLERFYEALSIELGYRKISPIVIQPGNVNTGFNETGNEYTPRGNAFVDQAYQRVVRAIDSRNGMDPAVVAKAVVDALTTRRPRFRYIVGMNAIKAHWAKRLLGTDWSLNLLARYFGF